MGKTFRRDQQYRPKKGGRVFNKDKDQNWKKKKSSSPKEIASPLPPDDIGYDV